MAAGGKRIRPPRASKAASQPGACLCVPARRQAAVPHVPGARGVVYCPAGARVKWNGATRAGPQGDRLPRGMGLDRVRNAIGGRRSLRRLKLYRVARPRVSCWMRGMRRSVEAKRRQNEAAKRR